MAQHLSVPALSARHYLLDSDFTENWGHGVELIIAQRGYMRGTHSTLLIIPSFVLYFTQHNCSCTQALAKHTQSSTVLLVRRKKDEVFFFPSFLAHIVAVSPWPRICCEKGWCGQHAYVGRHQPGIRKPPGQSLNHDMSCNISSNQLFIFYSTDSYQRETQHGDYKAYLACSHCGRCLAIRPHQRLCYCGERRLDFFSWCNCSLHWNCRFVKGTESYFSFNN